MEAKTTIEKLLSQGSVFVPDYQRAYAWGESQRTQFVKDLSEYQQSSSNIPYYFGHFLFEHSGNDIDGKDKFAVIDGQQRLTTIVIFLCVIFKYLKNNDATLKDNPEFYYLYNSMIKLGNKYRFATVKYDNEYFQSRVIDDKSVEIDKFDTLSKENIDKAYSYFEAYIKKQNVEKARKLLNVVTQASCTTHVVSTPTEGAQMFIFQNDRGKKPTDLEVIKAQFMYRVHLANISQGDKDKCLLSITQDFEKIYKLIALLSDKVDEDDILLYTLCIKENNLRVEGAKEIVLGYLNKEGVQFVESFTKSLLSSFECILKFYKMVMDMSNNFAVYTLATISKQMRILMPFVIKLLSTGVSDSDFERFAVAFTKISVRNSIIATRARLIDRLNNPFKEYCGDVSGIIDRIDYLMKTQSGYWGYWGNKAFESALYGLDGNKEFLWLYENHLRQEKGLLPLYYKDFEKGTEIEHIAPQNECKLAKNGYFEYKDDWQSYVYCIGNCLVLSKRKNENASNKTFSEKLALYTENLQQKEVCDMVIDNSCWSKDMISKRHKKITDFLLSEY